VNKTGSELFTRSNKECENRNDDLGLLLMALNKEIVNLDVNRERQLSEPGEKREENDS
jgi:hypothetical protein